MMIFVGFFQCYSILAEKQRTKQINYSFLSLSSSLDTQDTLQGSIIVKEISARNSSVQLISTYAQTPCIFELTQCIYKIIESGPILVKGYVKVRKFAIPMRFKSLHPRMQSIWAHCLYLVLNTQDTSHFY